MCMETNKNGRIFSPFSYLFIYSIVLYLQIIYLFRFFFIIIALFIYLLFHQISTVNESEESWNWNNTESLKQQNIPNYARIKKNKIVSEKDYIKTDITSDGNKKYI